MERELERPELVDLVKERCPYLFAARPVFVSKAHLQRMASVVLAVESMVALPAYLEEVLAGAPAIARHEPGARSVFFGYDFHVEGDRLGLIEINTNAGGAMLNAVLARALSVPATRRSSRSCPRRRPCRRWSKASSPCSATSGA